MSIFSRAFFDADPFGKLIFFSLFLLSIWSWYVLFYKGNYFRTLEKNNTLFCSLFSSQQGNILELELEPNKKSSYFEVSKDKEFRDPQFYKIPKDVDYM